jgi:hypothetical protein
MWRFTGVEARCDARDGIAAEFRSTSVFSWARSPGGRLFDRDTSGAGIAPRPSGKRIRRVGLHRMKMLSTGTDAKKC